MKEGKKELFSTIRFRFYLQNKKIKLKLKTLKRHHSTYAVAENSHGVGIMWSPRRASQVHLTNNKTYDILI